MKLNFITFFILLNYIAFSQKATIDSNSVSNNSPSNKFSFRPELGLGFCKLSFYGDMYDKHFSPPSKNKIGFDISVGHALTDYLKADIFFLYGKLSAEERYANTGRNLNFESQIISGGLNLQYNFGNFLKKERMLSPYISLGVEIFQFNSKTDLKDKNGNIYCYWADGSIRNLPESDINASGATELQRDFTYETDLRALNADGFGNYSNIAVGVPVGAGVIFNLSDRIKLKAGAAMHFTFTDYIDGITEKSIGARAGNNKKDNFTVAALSLSYTFGKLKKEESELFNELENADEDNDKILDFNDQCPGTPKGVSVDSKGCPLDKDKDNVPDYRDDEPESAKGAMVDAKGVTVKDVDTTVVQQSAPKDSLVTASDKIIKKDKKKNTKATGASDNVEYMVSLGSFEKGIPDTLMKILLSIPDMEIVERSANSSEYLVGNYTDIYKAEKRKQEMNAIGFLKAKVVLKEKGKLPKNAGTNELKPNKGIQTKSNVTVEGNKSHRKNAKNERLKGKNYYPETNIQIPGIVFRVQVGAFIERQPKSFVKDINDIIEIIIGDGLYRYTSGAFDKYAQADAYKNELLNKGYAGAYVTAYKNGVRIPMKEALGK